MFKNEAQTENLGQAETTNIGSPGNKIEKEEVKTDIDMYEKFEVDKNIPYRLYFNKNVIDFIDIKEVIDSGLENVLFKDDSPIKKIIQYESIHCLQIEKEHSIWRLWYWDSTPRLQLIIPEIKENIDRYSKRIIFERSNRG